MKYYMHTIEGKPGFFDGWQVCYAKKYSPWTLNVLATSLRQIKREQQLSIRNRRSKGYPALLGEYGYILVYLP